MGPHRRGLRASSCSSRESKTCVELSRALRRNCSRVHVLYCKRVHRYRHIQPRSPFTLQPHRTSRSRTYETLGSRTVAVGSLRCRTVWENSRVGTGWCEGCGGTCGCGCGGLAIGRTMHEGAHQTGEDQSSPARARRGGGGAPSRSRCTARGVGSGRAGESCLRCHRSVRVPAVSTI